MAPKGIKKLNSVVTGVGDEATLGTVRVSMGGGGVSPRSSARASARMAANMPEAKAKAKVKVKKSPSTISNASQISNTSMSVLEDRVKFKDVKGRTVIFRKNQAGTLDFFVEGRAKVTKIKSVRAEGATIHYDGTKNLWSEDSVTAQSADIAEQVVKLADKTKEESVGPRRDEFGLTYYAKSDDTLLPVPETPKYHVALCAAYVTSHPSGGSDKLVNGHRFDTIAIANGLINSGIAVSIIYYNVDEHDKFFEVVDTFDGIIIRINPGQITANGGSQQKFDDDMMKLAAKFPVWPTPETMSKMGAKDALCQIKTMDFGLEDTLGYYSPEDISKGLRKTVAFQPRVVKQNRGSAGEGIWIIKLKSEDYCKTYGEREAADDEVLILKEANDNHIEEHTVAQFIEFCVNGRTDKSGTWTSKGTGKYFEGGAEAGGQMVDQRFLPRIDEGEARFVMIGKELNRVEHYVYIGGVGGETKTTIHKPSDEKFPYTDIQTKLQDEIPTYLKALGLADDALPLLWAADFIPVDDHKSPLVIGEFNCSCLGLAGFLNVRGGDIKDIKPEDEAMGMAMANLIGQKALVALESGKK